MEDLLYQFVGLYKKSPLWVKKIIGTTYGFFPYSFRYGKQYADYKSLAGSARQWSIKDRDEFLLTKLIFLVRHAYETVPFYKKKYDEAGVGPDTLRSLQDFEKFPCVTREDIKNNRELLLSTAYGEGDRLYTATSGSSGVPLELFHHKGVTRAKERAFLHDLFEQFGYRPGQKYAVFRGEIIENDTKPWYFDPIDKALILSSYKLSSGTVQKYCDIMIKENIKTIRGYPFMIFKLVQLMEEAGIKAFTLNCIILESENIYELHREKIKAFFNCPVCHYYGHTERLGFGGNCLQSEQYFMHPAYGHTEVLTTEGQVVDIGAQGEIVTTGFDNLVMPLIRYRTQDFAIKGAEHRDSGLCYPVLEEVMGREEEFVYLIGGETIPFHNLLAGIHSGVWGLAYKMQCVQQNIGELIINIVPEALVDPKKAENAFKEEISRRVPANKLALTAVTVDAIPVTKSGKTKLFLQKCSAE